jgi:hypothetical protein
MQKSIPTIRRNVFKAVASAGVFAFVFSLGAIEALAQSPLAELQVFDRGTGSVVPTYFKNGRYYVPGRPGAKYAIRVKNLTSERILTVLSVDGINVITGKTADWRQNGYVIEERGTTDINGWRKNTTEVAAFEFATIDRSYAVKTGRPTNVGVIGMAVFRELRPPPAMPSVAFPPPPPSGDRADAGLASSKNAAAPYAAEKLGTAHGEREHSASTSTTFLRLTDRPAELHELEYDSYERLVAAGVIRRQPASGPRSFPANESGFVPDPPN